MNLLPTRTGSPSASPREAKARPWLRVLLMGLVAAGSLALAGRNLYVYVIQPRLEPPMLSEAPFDASRWAWRSEEHWAVDQSARDIAEMLIFAAGKKPEDHRIEVQPVDQVAHHYRVRVSGPGLASPLEVDLPLAAHLWDPGDFRALAQQLATRLGLAATPAVPSRTAEILQILLTPTPSEIEKAQNLASGELTHHPLSATAHEDAAAVLSVLALFDEAGTFQDDRFLLCRATAHLALAQSLRGPSEAEGPSGRLATIANGILLHSAARTLKALEDAGKAPEPKLPDPWLRTLGMLATRDWRPVANPGEATSAEALASFLDRDFSSHDRGKMRQWLRQDTRKWTLHLNFIDRTAIRGRHSVAIGHEASEALVDRDLRDFLDLCRQRGETPPSSAKGICGSLNALPTRAYDPRNQGLEVLGQGVWARCYQAILLCDMMGILDFYEHQYGSPETTDEFWADMDKRFAELDLFPMLQKRFAHDRKALYAPPSGRPSSSSRRTLSWFQRATSCASRGTRRSAFRRGPCRGTSSGSGFPSPSGPSTTP